MKTTTKQLDIINTCFVCISTLIVFISAILITNIDLTIENYSYNLGKLSILGLIIIIANKLLTNFKLKPYRFIILYAIFGAISTLLSGHIIECIKGAPGRNEGYMVILFYIIVFIVASLIKNDKLKELIINVIIIAGIISICYAAMQFFRIIPNKNLYPKSFFGNSNSYGEFCVLVTGLSFGLYMYSNKSLYFLYFIISAAGLIISGCMGCYVGLLAIFIINILYIISIKRKRKEIKPYILKLFVLIGILIPILFVSINYRKHIIDDVKEVLYESKEILKGNSKSSFGTIRFEIWGKALKSAPKYIIHGVGIDRFEYALDNGRYISSNNRVVDKAHNDYIQIFITQGIFALICYLIHVAKVLIVSYKESSKSYIYVALLFASIGYLTQIFFEISVTRVAPYFFIIMGLAYKVNEEKIATKKKN